MGTLSDIDIKKALNKDILIEPFFDKFLTPVGYDFTVGDFVFSLENGLIGHENGSYEIPSKNTVQILTRESLWVSHRIAGTFHSKVSLVSKGLSHISTTLDPGWYGPLLITLRNNTNESISLKPEDPFVTLIFSKLETPTKSPHNKPPCRKDILVKQLKEQTQEYIDKIASVLNDKVISSTFATMVQEANRPMLSKVIASLKNKNRATIVAFTVKSTLACIIVALITLNFYWDYVKKYFHGISYDSKVFAVQVTAIIAVVSLLISISKKQN